MTLDDILDQAESLADTLRKRSQEDASNIAIVQQQAADARARMNEIRKGQARDDLQRAHAEMQEMRKMIQTREEEAAEIEANAMRAAFNASERAEKLEKELEMVLSEFDRIRNINTTLTQNMIKIKDAMMTLETENAQLAHQMDEYTEIIENLQNRNNVLKNQLVTTSDRKALESEISTLRSKVEKLQNQKSKWNRIEEENKVLRTDVHRMKDLLRRTTKQKKLLNLISDELKIQSR